MPKLPRALSLSCVAWLLSALIGVGTVAAADDAMPTAPAPAGIAIDADDNAYVTDYAFDRVIRFAPDGTVLGQWGSSGNGAGQLNAPFGIALDDHGAVIVVDQLNNRVQRFATDGTPLGAFGSAGAAPGALRTPFGVAVSGNRVFIADFGNDRIQIYSTDGTYQTALGGRGSGEGQFLRPAAVALDRDGSVFVSDHFNDRIERFGSDGRFQAQFGAAAASPLLASGGLAGSAAVPVAGAAPTTPTPTVPSTTPTVPSTTPVVADVQLRRPEGLAIDKDGSLWVADYGHDRVAKLSPDGHVLLSVGNRGSGVGEFVGPKGIALDAAGRVYVADTGNGRVQRLLADGTPDVVWYLP